MGDSVRAQQQTLPSHEYESGNKGRVLSSWRMVMCCGQATICALNWMQTARKQSVCWDRIVGRFQLSGWAQCEKEWTQGGLQAADKWEHWRGVTLVQSIIMERSCKGRGFPREKMQLSFIHTALSGLYQVKRSFTENYSSHNQNFQL